MVAAMVVGSPMAAAITVATAAAIAAATAAAIAAATAAAITVAMVGTTAATAGGAAIMVGEAAGTVPGLGGASDWVCILRLCPCITRPFGGKGFPTTMRTTSTIGGTPRSASTKR